MRKIYFVSLLIFLCSFVSNAQSYFNLSSGSYTQNWSNTGALTTNDDWTGVPNIRGFLGQDITTATGANPQTLLGVSASATDLDLIANQTNPNITNGGVAEFQIADPTIALQGSGTADAPYIVLYMNTSGVSNIRVRYNLRDIDGGTTDDAIMQVALQYRIGNTGNFTNVPAGYVADATTGPSLATLVTPIDVTLPAACDNQAQVEIRIMTTNAVGNDEWVGIDDIDISGSTTTVNTVSVAAGTNAAEPASNGSFTINFSTATTVPTDINFAYTGTASFGTDYSVSYSAGTTPSVTSTGTLTVPAGTSSITVTITPVDDPDVESLENIILTLSSPTADYTLGTNNASINLADNDVALSASVAAGVNAAEPATNGTFVINLSGNAPAGGITVNYTLGGTATSADYSDALAGSITIPQNSNSGTITLSVIDDLLFEGTETITITLNSATNGATIGTSNASINLTDNDNPPPANVVINQVYGGGGNSGATFKNDFIELYNNENTPVNLTGWSVQYLNAAGTGNWTVTPLSGTIPPHSFFLIQEAAGAGGTTSLPAPDVTGTIAMGATAGKVLLSNSTVAQNGANPSGITVIDKVGYAPTATGFETAPTAAPENATALVRVADGVDNNNNSIDFVVATPIPRNRFYTTTPPAIISLSPANNSVDVPYNIPLTITFDKPVLKGTGNITLFENGVAGPTIDVNSPSITISNNSVVTINTTLNGGVAYSIQISAGAFEDVYGNDFAGITNATTWSFTSYNSSVAVNLPANFDLQNCTGTGLLPSGFTQFNQAGATTWDCTPFGRDPAAPNGTAAFPNAVQMNGFANGTNVPNIDWLISPSLNLTGSTFPLLSFWSRTAFNGQPLQLKISTDYTSGDPNLATWNDLNGKFPGLASNIWTLSSDINLSAFKQANVHIAFIYTSSDEEGARWTLDDISVINSATPPPPSLTVSTTDLQFNFVANGSTGDKTFNFIGNDLTDVVTLNASADFLLSKDGGSFSPSLTYTVAEANNINETVYVRFAPSQANQNFTGTVAVATSTLADTVNLKGTSIDPATTLEVVNWNMEWFGSTDPSLGPTNDPLQEQNAKTVLTSTGADLFALIEVVDESRLASIVSQMPGYSYVICNFGSHVNPNENNPSPLGEAQKAAFVYKTSMFSNITTTALLTNGVNTAGDLSNPAYNYWSSGRYPFMMSADVTLNCVTKNIKFILVHAKANTSPTATAYARRKSGADSLYFTLNNMFPNDNVVILGDFNDDLDKSITSGFTTTSWNSFTDDPVNYTAVTLPLSLAGKKSTTGFNDVIDHVIVSNDMAPYYMPSSATILSDVTSLVTNYGTTTSDHFPVFTRYKFEQPAPPVITCPDNIVKNNDAGVCGATVTYTVPVSGGCGTKTLKQTAGLASGAVFPVGVTTNTFVVTDAAGGTATCSFTVTVNDTENPTINCPVNITRNADPGSCGAVVNYTVNFADNCTGAVIQQTSGLASGATFPAGTTANTFVVTDAAGHTATCSFTVTVTDNIAPTFTKPADKTINFNGTCTYDASVAFTGDVTNESDNCSNGLQATFTDSVTSCGNNVTIYRKWKLADANGNQAPAQIQKITVTDNSTPYIVYATKEARFAEFNLINGSVGVTSSTGVAEFKTGTVILSPDFAKAKNITVQPGAFIPNRISTPASDGPNPPFFLFSGTTTGLSNRTVSATTTTPVSTNHKELRIKKNVSVTITGTLYGKIIIEEGAQVTFTPAGGILNVEDMQIDGSASNNTRVKFGACTSVRIRNTVEVGGYVMLNVNGPKVTFYLGDNTTDDEQFIVDDGFNIISVNIYIKKGQLRLKDNADLVAMKGWFIVESLISQGSGIVWDDNDCNSSGSTQLNASNSKQPYSAKGETEPGSSSLSVKASPNPSTDQFTLVIESSSKEPITLKIADVSGRMLSLKPGITPNTTLKTGSELRNGVYFAEVIQGQERKVVKLIKL